MQKNVQALVLCVCLFCWLVSSHSTVQLPREGRVYGSWRKVSVKSGRSVQFHGSDAQRESGARFERTRQPQRTNLLSTQHWCCWSRIQCFSKFNSSHTHSYCEHVRWAEKWSKLPAEQKSTWSTCVRMFFIVILTQWSLWCAVCARFTIISLLTSIDIYSKHSPDWENKHFTLTSFFLRLVDVVWWAFLPSLLCGSSVVEGQEWGGVSRCWCWPEGALCRGSFLTSGWAPASLEWLWDPDWMTTSLLSLKKRNNRFKQTENKL